MVSKELLIALVVVVAGQAVNASEKDSTAYQNNKRESSSVESNLDRKNLSIYDVMKAEGRLQVLDHDGGGGTVCL